MRSILDALQSDGAPFGLRNAVPKVALGAPRSVTVTDTDLEAVLQTAPTHVRLFVLLCHDCALRSGTAVRVSRRHINDAGEIVAPTKRGQIARIPMSGRLAALVAALPRGDAPLVELARGRTFSQGAAIIAWHAVCDRLGIPRGMRPHDLRRTMAEKVYHLTADLRVAQTLLGHRQLKSTLDYLQRPAQTSADAMEAAVETLCK